MKKIIAFILLTSSVAYGQNTFPASGNVGIGTTSPGAKLSFTNVDGTSLSDGITWYNPTPLDYGIYRTAGSWVNPNYQQLKLNFETGIILNPGSAYGKSYVEVQGGGLRISSGNVGIGTLGAGGKLDINAGSQYAIRTLTSSRYVIEVRNSSSPNGGWWLANDPSGSFAIHENNVGDKFTIASGGNVGIGTTSPTGLLEIKGAYTGNSQLIINAVGTSGELRFSEDGVPKGFVWYGKSGNYMAFGRGSTSNSMFVNSTGDFGIGTTTPDAKLAVKGQIHAQEVKVDLNGAIAPDYVFASNYQLPTLDYIKTYIDRNKHLPEVPSAKEMETNGVNLGEMNMLLLKKIEELTLHIIDQNKRINALEQSNKK